MKNVLLLIFSFSALSGFVQNITDGWICPVANIEFRNGKVIYYYSADECASLFDKLHPVHYDCNLLELTPVIGAGCAKDYRQMEKEAFDYVANWQIVGAQYSDKYNYLKTVSMLLIWSSNYTGYLLPDNTLEMLKNLQAEPFAEISQSATSVIKLYYQYINE